MMSTKTMFAATLCLVGASARLVHADDQEVNVRSFEYVDVIETTDGSIWKGIVVEQTPNVQYKIATSDGSLHVIKAADVVKLTKQRNRDYQAPQVSPVATGGASPHPNGVATSYDAGGGGLPPPAAKPGLRIEPSAMIVFPAGDVKNAQVDTSFAPNVEVGYEALFGNIGIGGGGLGRFIYWRLPGMTDNASWTLETHAYGRAALHISRVAMYAGVALGVDTNYVNVVKTSTTTLGFGMNLQGGIDVAATPTLALKLGVDYHLPTDTIVSGANGSISYIGLMAGAALRM
jgi:hypothetical protein